MLHALVLWACAGHGVVDGDDASIEDFPFTVAIGILPQSDLVEITGKWQHICTGSLVAQNLVLTAAHCVYDMARRDGTTLAGHVTYRNLAVVHGVSDLEASPALERDRAALGKQNYAMGDKRAKDKAYAGVGEHVAFVTDVFNARDFQNGEVTLSGWSHPRIAFEDDVALLKLDRCVDAATVTLATSNGSHDDACNSATMLGWGRTESTVREFRTSATAPAEKSRLQMKAGQTLHTAETCAGELRKVAEDMSAEVRSQYAAVPETEAWQRYREEFDEDLLSGTSLSAQWPSQDRLVCFGGDAPSGICQGDSGGPLVVHDPETGQYVQVGVNSFVLGLCGRRADFAQRVSFYAPWIQSVVEEHANCWLHTPVFATPEVPFPQVSQHDRDLHCAPDQHQCAEDGQCFAASAKCNGVPECKYGSDERGCPGSEDACEAFDGLVARQRRDEMLRCGRDFYEVVRTIGLSHQKKQFQRERMAASCKAALKCTVDTFFATEANAQSIKGMKRGCTGAEVMAKLPAIWVPKDSSQSPVFAEGALCSGSICHPPGDDYTKYAHLSAMQFPALQRACHQFAMRGDFLENAAERIEAFATERMQCPRSAAPHGHAEDFRVVVGALGPAGPFAAVPLGAEEDKQEGLLEVESQGSVRRSIVRRS